MTVNALMGGGDELRVVPLEDKPLVVTGALEPHGVLQLCPIEVPRFKNCVREPREWLVSILLLDVNSTAKQCLYESTYKCVWERRGLTTPQGAFGVRGSISVP